VAHKRATNPPRFGDGRPSTLPFHLFTPLSFLQTIFLSQRPLEFFAQIEFIHSARDMVRLCDSPFGLSPLSTRWSPIGLKKTPLPSTPLTAPSPPHDTTSRFESLRRGLPCPEVGPPFGDLSGSLSPHMPWFLRTQLASLCDLPKELFCNFLPFSPADSSPQSLPLPYF